MNQHSNTTKKSTPIINTSIPMSTKLNKTDNDDDEEEEDDNIQHFHSVEVDDLSQSSFFSLSNNYNDNLPVSSSRISCDPILIQNSISRKDECNSNDNNISCEFDEEISRTSEIFDLASKKPLHEATTTTTTTTTATPPNSTPFHTSSSSNSVGATIISIGDDTSTNSKRTAGGIEGRRRRRRRSSAAALESLKPQKRKSNDLSEFTINKLNFSSLGIYGRDDEISIIRKAFEESFSSSTNSSISTCRNSSSSNKDSSSSSSVDIATTSTSATAFGQRHFICISGTSGTGKSKLADTLEIPTKKIKGLLVRGKFDLNLRNEPYFAFSRAYSEICAEILEKARDDPEGSLRIRNDIKESLDSELSLLTQVVPALTEIIDFEELLEQQQVLLQGNNDDNNNNYTNTVSTTSKDKKRILEESSTPPNHHLSSETAAAEVVSSRIIMTAEESKNRFQYAFLRFTRVISSHFKSFVMVLDDLQWADASSLELLRILISDHENPHLLMIGTYRSDEVANDPSHILLQTLNELESKCKESSSSGGSGSGGGDSSGSFQLTKIHLQNLGIDSVHKIIQDLLSTSHNDERSLKLAEICHKKTDGNVFYLLSFLALLKEQNLLKFNFGTVSWTWDEMEIYSSTNAASNVVELLLSRINLLPPNLIELMKLTSCLGSEFEVRIIELLWKKWTDVVASVEESNKDSLSDGLERLEQEGFIEPCTNKVVSSYRWAHDKIQEAGLSLIPEADRGSYNRRIGEILLSGLQDDDLDSIILVLVDLLNDDGGVTNSRSKDDSLLLARLNLKAGRKALSMSAFESAAVYAENGIRLLPSNSWAEQYQLSLGLYSLGANAEGAIGNVEKMNEFCHAVLSQEGIPTSDKFAVYNTWIDSIAGRGFFQEAIEILLSILREFKCTFPKNSIMVGLSLAKQIIKIQFGTKSKDFSKLNKMKDTTRFELMRFLDKLALYFYMIGDDRMPLVVFRSMNWSIKHGSCDYSPAAFATTGMMLTGILQDLQGGAHFGGQALELVEKNRTSPAKAKTIFCVYAFLLVWTKPAGEVIKPLLKAYEMSLQTGDAENALWAIFHSIIIRYLIGSPLESLEADLLMYSRQAKALRRDQAMFCCKILRQVCLNLMGRENIEDPTYMIGSSLSKEDFEYCKQNRFLQPVLRSWPNILLSYFGKHLDLAGSFEIDYLAKAQVSSPVNMWYSLVGGVSCFAAARQTGKKKYAKKGRRILSKFTKWVEGGNPNVRHVESFLEAELMVIIKKNFVARKSYEISILLAARSGFQHDAAFASERYGRYCLDVEKDLDEAGYRIRESIKYWESWGAMAKVRSLEVEFSDLIQEKPSQILCKPDGRNFF